MAKVSRNDPPRWAEMTIIPALGGASRTSFHSSVVKSDFEVMVLSDHVLRRHRHRSASLAAGNRAVSFS